MKSPWGLSDSVGGVIESPAKCRHCGATTRLGNGLCLSCTLREGLEGDREASRESFEAILAEDEVRDTQWRIGNYEILEEIGRGGMGVIYRARQRHSRRIVALKRIVSYNADSRETRERFRREAEAAASLDHPNILPIYEVGQGEDGLPFFSMKYEAGGSLQKAGPALHSDPRESVRLMAKVARAVQYAHEHGILHRDLKPGNILLDGRGEPFVTDFGLAKWLDTTTDLTRTLAIFGTPGYIAPEQAKGPAAKLTPAADVYSLGAVLFDLFTGRPPFLGEHALAVIQQATEKPAPKLRSIAPILDRDLETICARCLEREPQARYRSAGDLATDLERWLEGRPIIARRVSPPMRAWRWSKRNPKLAVATSAAVCSAMAAAFLFFSHNRLAPQSGLDSRLPPEKSIAMLPFENLSRDPDNAYFAEGIQDEILTRLAKIGALKVISRNSTQQYAARPGNLSEIARQLGVVSILEGSVQKAGDQVYINVQLIRAATDEHLWAESYNRKLENIFGVEGEVATAVAEALKAKLTGAEQQALEQKPTNNAEAYDAYLRGLAYSLRPEYFEADNLNAIKHFSDAVKLDPKFALAWAWLAHANALGYVNQIGADFQALGEEAKRAADQAIALKPDLAESCLAQGYSYYYGQRDYGSAIAWFEKARNLSPKNSQIPQALALVCRRLGEWQRSLDYFRQATQLDPRDAALLSSEAETFLMLRQYPAALKVCDQILDILPDNSTALAIKVQVYQAQGNLAAAAALLSGLSPHAGQKLFFAQTNQWAYERRYAEGIAALQAAAARPDLATTEYDKIFIESNLAWFQQLAGEAAAACSTWQHVRTGIEALRRNKGEDFADVELASASIALGDTATAFTIVERGAAIFSKDALATAGYSEIRARVAVQAGEKDLAIQQLAISAQNPTGVTYGDLKLNPRWDPLRGDPGFEKIVASLAPNAANK